VAERLAGLGITVAPRYGVGGYRVDFAAAHPAEPSRMVLAIEADGASYRDSRSARDRDRLRKEHLERLGWTFHRIWSTNWFSDPEAEVAKVQEAYREAVTRIGHDPGPDDANVPGPGAPSAGPGAPSPGSGASSPGTPAPGVPSPDDPSPDEPSRDGPCLDGPSADAPSIGDPARPGHAIALREPAVPEPTQTFPS
jgi:very-short-patch-repair endonuclease